MHEEICLVHVFFDELLVLLGVAATDDQVVFRGYKPDEFLEPEYLPIHNFVLLNLKFRVFFVRGLLCRTDGLIRRSLRFLFLHV